MFWRNDTFVLSWILNIKYVHKSYGRKGLNCWYMLSLFRFYLIKMHYREQKRPWQRVKGPGPLKSEIRYKVKRWQRGQLERGESIHNIVIRYSILLRVGSSHLKSEIFKESPSKVVLRNQVWNNIYHICGILFPWFNQTKKKTVYYI